MMTAYLSVSPYLNFNGDCEEAFAFYAAALGGTIALKRTYADMPMPDAPAGWDAKILHITMTAGSFAIQGSDVTPERYEVPRGFSLSITLDDVARAETIFEALSTGGTVDMAMQETFWSSRFGMLVDRFAVPWMINVDLPA
jgi:PhnB protein